MRKHYTDRDQLDRDIDMAGGFHEDPTLDAAIRTLRELPQENDLAIDRILSAVRAEKTVDVIPNVLATRRRSYWWQGTAAAAAAAALFGIGFVTGNGNRLAPNADNIAAASSSDPSESGVDAASETVAQDTWMHSNDGPLAITGQLASQGVNTVRESAPVTMQFSVTANEAKQVSLVGDFNGWDPGITPLRKVEDGRWIGTASLRPGHHTYAYMIDGTIVPDPKAVNVRDRDYDVIVSTIVVKGVE